ncbi:MAG: hypothetical protein MJ211_09935 [Bacteroidales bacterium]|nr:hypothetical protein [Bacteroidales bacterium]
MSFFPKKAKQPKKFGAKWLFYALILIGIICIFTPKLLIYKASKILEKNITDSVAINYPPKEVMVANNYLLTARYFPGFEEKGSQGQKLILDYYFPLFKKDYDILKYACVDKAIKEISKIDTISKDSINIIALESGWKKYPDSIALEEFRAKWDTYHKSFIKSLPNYYRFIDANHLR